MTATLASPLPRLLCLLSSSSPGFSPAPNSDRSSRPESGYSTFGLFPNKACTASAGMRTARTPTSLTTGSLPSLIIARTVRSLNTARSATCRTVNVCSTGMCALRSKWFMSLREQYGRARAPSTRTQRGRFALRRATTGGAGRRADHGAAPRLRRGLQDWRGRGTRRHAARWSGRR